MYLTRLREELSVMNQHAHAGVPDLAFLFVHLEAAMELAREAAMASPAELEHLCPESREMIGHYQANLRTARNAS